MGQRSNLIYKRGVKTQIFEERQNMKTGMLSTATNRKTAICH